MDSFNQWLLITAYKMGICVEELDVDDWYHFYEDGYTPEEAIDELCGSE